MADDQALREFGSADGDISSSGRPVTHLTPSAVDIGAVQAATKRIAANIEQVIEGKHDAVRLGVAVLLAEGHLLIEDVPGVGKTTFAKALARSIDCTVRRIQFTPDLLPSDVTGVSVYNAETRDFEFKPGPVFANIVVGDEINRASPKTQSALLECMEEQQVTVDGADLRARVAIHRRRDSEPDRHGGHLPAARSATRSVHRPYLDGLPEPAVRDRHALRARRAPTRSTCSCRYLMPPKSAR